MAINRKLQKRTLNINLLQSPRKRLSFLRFTFMTQFTLKRMYNH